MTRERRALGVAVRPVTTEDAAELAELYRSQRAFLAPYEPLRPEVFFTERGQRDAAAHALREAEADRLYRFAILAGGGLVGTITISNVTRGAFQNAAIGYFVAREWNGRGIASRAVGLTVDWAFEVARLHRVEAGTLLSNVASQRVLARNGFRVVGLSRRHLEIAGRWCDHLLFARSVEDPPVDTGDPQEMLRELERVLGP